MEFSFHCTFCSNTHLAVFVDDGGGMGSGAVGFASVENPDISKQFIYACPTDQYKKDRSLTLKFTSAEAKLLKKYRFSGVR